jgi:vancomycin resistance protein VanJ
LVQESGSRARLRALADATGLVSATDPIVFPRRRIRNAALVRPALGPRWHRLLRFGGASWFAPRGALIAGLEGLTVVSVHLGLARGERRRHAEQLLDALAALGHPVVLGGDLNAHPDDPATVALASAFPDVWSSAGSIDGATAPAAAPVARIDYLLASPGVRARRTWLAGGPGASDHLSVVADLRLT